MSGIGEPQTVAGARGEDTSASRDVRMRVMCEGGAKAWEDGARVRARAREEERANLTMVLILVFGFRCVLFTSDESPSEILSIEERFCENYSRGRRK